MSNASFPYIELSYPVGRKINDTLLQLHHAVQYIALAGKAYGIASDDDSHTAMIWDQERLAYMGPTINEMPLFRVALHAAKLNLLLMNEDSREFANLHLPGVTKGYAFAWLKEQVAAMGGDHTLLNRNMHYQIPDHAVAQGHPFRIQDPEAFREASRYRTNAGNILKYIKSHYRDSSDILIWPHHFDTGFTINYARNTQQKVVKTIGAGFAVADEFVGEPYFYINSWSEEGMKYPENLPALKAGQWNTGKWTGAVLPLDNILQAGDAEGQKQLIQSFFDNGISVTVDFLG